MWEFFLKLVKSFFFCLLLFIFVSVVCGIVCGVFIYFGNYLFAQRFAFVFSAFLPFLFGVTLVLHFIGFFERVKRSGKQWSL